MDIISPVQAVDITKAAHFLSEGKLVSFPTETVYGLGADAENDAAVAAIFAAKGRPSFNPLIVHVANIEMAKRYVQWNDVAEQCAQQFWAGPLTLVLKKREDAELSSIVTAGLGTVAIRMPNHPIAHSILNEFGRGIAAPSANRSGKLSPTSAQHVAYEFAQHSDDIAMVLDGGETEKGIESTILYLASDAPVILRYGSITKQMLAELFPQVQDHHKKLADEAKPLAPGMLKSHYAPNTKLYINASEFDIAKEGAVLTFGDCTIKRQYMLNLSPEGNLTEAAANLFAYLRELDSLGVDAIYVTKIPNIGIGQAINDRLRRAAL